MLTPLGRVKANVISLLCRPVASKTPSLFSFTSSYGFLASPGQSCRIGQVRLGQDPNLSYLSLQPSDYLLSCKHFSEKFPFQAPSPRGRGQVQNCTKTLLGQVGVCVQNFIKIGAGLWITISHPHTNRQTNKHLFAHFIRINKCRLRELGFGNFCNIA